jgi:uncharacterized membrane protein
MTDRDTDRSAADGRRDRHRTAQIEVLVSVAAGAAVAMAVGVPGPPVLGLLLGWDTACVVYMIWIWVTILRCDADQTAQRATTTDPDRTVTDVLLLTAAVASLAAVGTVLVQAAQMQGLAEGLRIGLGLASVVLSWALVHTVYTLRYAHLYYDGPDGGIDFNDSGRPTYHDFAYVAFTMGMTFQVSDTSLTSQPVRRAALRHALLSYLFGTGILASTVNLVASLGSK